MTFTTASAGANAITPDEYADLIIRPMERESIALQVANVVTTAATTTWVPVVVTDAGAAWVAEGAEITTADAVMDEIEVTPKKLAGLSIVSNELASDSSPGAQQIVGDGLARNCATKLDAAFFGAVASPAPAGLGALTGFNAVDAGTAFTGLDPFLEAISEAEAVGASLTSFVANPADALTLSKVKETAESQRTLLQAEPTEATRWKLAGVPLYVSAGVTAGTVWGLDSSRNLIVRREDVSIAISTDAYFSSDRVGIRATARFGFAFAHPASVQKITLSAG